MKNNIVITLSIAIVIVAASLTVSSCSTGRSMGQRGDYRPVTYFSPLFDEYWSSRTITVTDRTQPMEGGGRVAMGGMGGQPGDGMGGGGFPLIVRATLIDSVLINKGIYEYSKMAGLSEAEADEYLHRYKERYSVNDRIVIWAQIITAYSELYLDLERWTFYIESASGRTYQPIGFEEREIDIQSFFPGHSPGIQQRGFGSGRNMKTVVFYFPKHRSDGTDLIVKGDKRLKFGVVYRSNTDEQVSGQWELNRFLQ
jgi:hypothetical protein